MQQSDFDTFSAMLTAVSELYSKTSSTFAIGLYWNALKDYDLAAVRQAFDRHVRNPDNGQFMPKPADLIRMMSGSTQDGALQAWAKVDKAVRSVGTYADVVFDDPLIHRVVHDMGGWVRIGGHSDDEWPFVGKEFENRYRGYAMRRETPEYQPVLTGIANAQNQRNGMPLMKPVLIGNPAVAESVRLGGKAGALLGITRMDEVAAQMKQIGRAA